jgi:long-chain acyl-CoA synthetase
MLNSPQYLELFYAIPEIGAIIVPVNYRLSPGEIAFVLRDSGSTVLVVDDRFAAGTRVPGVRYLFAGAGSCPDGMADYEALLGSVAPAPAAPEPADEDLFGLFYTSGTTGGPKGVMLTHANIWANTLAVLEAYPAQADEVWLHAPPMFHLADAEMIPALVLQGAAHAFLPLFSPTGLVEAVKRWRVTGTGLVPAMIQMLVSDPTVESCDVSTLRRLFYGASPVPPDVLLKARQKLSCGLIQGYGLTEASPMLTWLSPEDHDDDALPNARKSAGRPVPGVTVRVVDELDRELPPGQAGEVVARGANIMKGYWNQPAITAETMRGGWLHTGDIGVFDDAGYLHILDRKKDMIKTGGENVFSPEVESSISAHPEVLEVAVIGVPDAKWGEAVHAMVVRRQGVHLTGIELIAWCRERMAHFKCPRSVNFLDSLPRNGTGKIRKTVLREIAAAASQEPGSVP